MLRLRKKWDSAIAAPSIKLGSNVVIGRAEPPALSVTHQIKSKFISRKHASITHFQNDFVLTVHTTNGVAVNGAVIAPHTDIVIRNGDVIALARGFAYDVEGIEQPVVSNEPMSVVESVRHGEACSTAEFEERTSPTVSQSQESESPGILHREEPDSPRVFQSNSFSTSMPDFEDKDHESIPTPTSFPSTTGAKRKRGSHSPSPVRTRDSECHAATGTSSTFQVQEQLELEEMIFDNRLSPPNISSHPSQHHRVVAEASMPGTRLSLTAIPSLFTEQSQVDLEEIIFGNQLSHAAVPSNLSQHIAVHDVQPSNTVGGSSGVGGMGGVLNPRERIQMVTVVPVAASIGTSTNEQNTGSNLNVRTLNPIVGLEGASEAPPACGNQSLERPSALGPGPLVGPAESADVEEPRIRNSNDGAITLPAVLAPRINGPREPTETSPIIPVQIEQSNPNPIATATATTTANSTYPIEVSRRVTEQSSSTAISTPSSTSNRNIPLSTPVENHATAGGTELHPESVFNELNPPPDTSNLKVSAPVVPPDSTNKGKQAANPQTPTSDWTERVSEHLLCAICFEMLVAPHGINPCGHTFW